MNKRLVERILFIGWGSAEWGLVKKLSGKQLLPNLTRLMDQSVHARLSALDPPVHSAQWTSINTGKIPLKHGIYHEAYPNSVCTVPNFANSLKVQFIWEILSQEGLKAHQIGAPVSYPTKPINGVSISDFFFEDIHPIKHEMMHPASLQTTYLSLKEEAVKEAHSLIDSWVSDEGKDHPQFDILRDVVLDFLMHSHWIFYSARATLQDREWDCCHIFFTRLNELTHVFTRFSLLKNKDLDKKLHASFRDVLQKAYILLDVMLGELLMLVDDNTCCLLVSEAGYSTSKSYIDKLDFNNSTYEYNQTGFLLMRSLKSIKQQELFGVTVLDIVPTILALLDIALSKDMDGKVIIAPEYFKTLKDMVESYDLPEQRNQIGFDDNWEVKGYRDRLENLGYPLQLGEDCRDYIRARTEIAAGQHQSAFNDLIRLHKKYPDNSWIGGRLAGVYLTTNQLKEAEKILDGVLNLGDGIPELHLHRGNLYLMQMKYRSASVQYDIAERNAKNLPNIFNQIGEAYNKMEKWAIAQKYFEKEVKINPKPSNYMSLVSSLLQRKLFKQAIPPLKELINIAPYIGTAWFHLGNCQYHLKEYVKAADTFEEAKKRNTDPRIGGQIQQALVVLYRDHLNRKDKLKEMQEQYEKSIGSRGTMTIVSGLPRSGTSMMMQMLVSGGMEAFTDGNRTADDNNVKGYFEHEAIKALASNNQILMSVGDKAVKIISHLLQHLPHVYRYKIIFMDRDIEEVMNSQQKMLGRLGMERGEDKSNSMSLLNTFKESRQKAIKWCRQRTKYVDLLIVPYNKAVVEPMVQAKRVNEFLGGELDTLKMAAVVDPTLYREKSKDLV